jgi:hypothetical protein
MNGVLATLEREARIEPHPHPLTPGFFRSNSQTRATGACCSHPGHQIP